MRPVFWRKDASGGRELLPLDFSPHRARRNLSLGIVADAFVLTGVVARHDIEFAIVFTKPDRSRYSGATLTKASETNVFLAMDFGRDRVAHQGILPVIHKSPRSGNGCGSRALIRRDLSYARRTKSRRLLPEWAI